MSLKLLWSDEKEASRPWRIGSRDAGDDRHAFDLAMRSLLEGVPAGREEGAEGHDQKVTKGRGNPPGPGGPRQRVPGVQHPGGPGLHVHVKDIERVGDYAKNLLDLSRDGADFSSLPDVDDWRELRADVADYVTASAEVFKVRDTDAGPMNSSQGRRPPGPLRPSGVGSGERQGPGAPAHRPGTGPPLL